MSFRSAKSRLKIDKNGDMGRPGKGDKDRPPRPRAKSPATFGRVGWQGGGHGRLLESDRNWQESDNAFRTPCTPKGCGSECAMRREPAAPVFED